MKSNESITQILTHYNRKQVADKEKTNQDENNPISLKITYTLYIGVQIDEKMIKNVMFHA